MGTNTGTGTGTTMIWGGLRVSSNKKKNHKNKEDENHFNKKTF